MRLGKLLLLTILIAVFCIGFYKKPVAEYEHLDGIYILELVSVTESGVQLMPLYIFPGDSQWSYYFCQTEKENMRRKYAHNKSKVIVECFKQGKAEI